MKIDNISDKDSLWREYKRTGNKELEKSIIRIYLYLVKIVVNQVYPLLYGNVEKDDLESYGIFGLIDAIKKNYCITYSSPKFKYRYYGEKIESKMDFRLDNIKTIILKKYGTFIIFINKVKDSTESYKTGRKRSRYIESHKLRADGALQIITAWKAFAKYNR